MLDKHTPVMIVPAFGSAYYIDGGELIQSPLSTHVVNTTTGNFHIVAGGEGVVDFERGVEVVDQPIMRTMFRDLADFVDLHNDALWRHEAQRRLDALKRAASAFQETWEAGGMVSIDGQLVEDYPEELPSFDEVTAALNSMEISSPDVREAPTREVEAEPVGHHRKAAAEAMRDVLPMIGGKDEDTAAVVNVGDHPVFVMVGTDADGGKYLRLVAGEGHKLTGEEPGIYYPEADTES